ANVDNWYPSQSSTDHRPSTNALDKWVLSRITELTQSVTDSLENCDTVAAIATADKFISDFSTWYIRRSRDRVGPTVENANDKDSFYQTCF
ncbi:MAG: class I tRNA ligase family protein, partial [Alphaproteobacteria bacterium]|nr:class I tRNA ligase family protein [Alphaproteobacteria bacterium]